MQLFMQLIERVEGDYEDLIKLTCDQIHEHKKQVPKLVADAKRKIAKLTKLRKRVKYRGKEHNFIADLLAQQATMLEQQIAKVNEQTKIGDRALELLKDFEYEIEREVKVATPDDTALYVFNVFGSFRG